MSKRTRRLEARVEVLEREVERLRELMALPPPPYITPDKQTMSVELVTT